MKPTFVISCPIDTYSGYGARGRDVAKAVIELDKYDVKILPQRWGNTPWGFIDDNPEWEFLKNYFWFPKHDQQYPRPDIWVQITIPNEFVAQGHYNIGITAGRESTVAPADWVQGCNRMNLILGSSNHTINVLKNSKFEKKDNNTQQVVEHISFSPNVKTDILFEGVDLNTYKPTTESLDLPEIKESFCFLFVGHWIQGDFGHDRKNISLLIKSFCETFKNKSKQPALILKTSQGGLSYIDRDIILKKIDKIKKTVRGKLPKIYLIHGDLTNEEMNSLYNHPKVKLMISLTKGEGFGRPLLEFTQTKKPILTTGWSGHIDFLKPNMSILLPGTLNDVHRSAQNKWLIKGSKWFDVDTMALGKALKDIYKNYKIWVPKAKQQGNYCKEHFSFDKMKEKLGTILENNVVAAPKQVPLQLPKLKKVNKQNQTELPKLQLPKLKKVKV
jgi:glycosyltransferase involved in cell wall biosynthesis